jgi:hypothetical protein
VLAEATLDRCTTSAHENILTLIDTSGKVYTSIHIYV